MEVASEVVVQGLDLWVAGEKAVQQAEGVAGVGWIDGTEWDGLGLTEVDFDDLNVRALFVLLAVGLVARRLAPNQSLSSSCRRVVLSKGTRITGRLSCDPASIQLRLIR